MFFNGFKQCLLLSSIKLYADSFADMNILVGVGQHTCLVVAAEHLYHVAVATTTK